MHTVVYDHPLRTVWLTWELDTDGIPTIVDYGDQAPGGDLPPADTLILHSDQVHSHHFPGSSTDDARTTAEILTFLPEIPLENCTVRILPSIGEVFDAEWNTILAWEERPSPSQVFSDIEADLMLLQSQEPTIFAGRRGSTWWFGVTENRLIYLDRQPHPHTDVDHFLHEQIDNLLVSVDLPVRKATLFGDTVSPDMLRKLTKQLSGRLDSIERVSPFQHVRSALDNDTSANILRRAHLIGCMAAPMLSIASPSTDIDVSRS